MFGERSPASVEVFLLVPLLVELKSVPGVRNPAQTIEYSYQLYPKTQNKLFEYLNLNISENFIRIKCIIGLMKRKVPKSLLWAKCHCSIAIYFAFSSDRYCFSYMSWVSSGLWLVWYNICELSKSIALIGCYMSFVSLVSPESYMQL